MGELLLALDFGGTKHSAALLRRGETTWRAQRTSAAPPAATAQTDIEVMLALARDMLGESKPDAIGVSFGGPVDAPGGIVRLSHHVPGWEDFPLRTLLQSRLGAPAAIDNDANVGAIGEHRFGAARGRNGVLYITVSTGVGGGWVLNGRVWHGADGMAGEIGHTVIDPSGPLCLCGKRGCVERLSSGPYIAQDARAQMEADPACAPILRSLAGGNLSAVTGRVISEAAAAGDDLSIGLLRRSGHALGVAIGNAANLLNPDIVVLAGGLTKSGDFFWRALHEAARGTALPQVSVNVVPAQFSDDAPLRGAVALAEQVLQPA